jgi:hypothetical protein
LQGHHFDIHLLTRFPFQIKDELYSLAHANPHAQLSSASQVFCSPLGKGDKLLGLFFGFINDFLINRLSISLTGLSSLDSEQFRLGIRPGYGLFGNSARLGDPASRFHFGLADLV